MSREIADAIHYVADNGISGLYLSEDVGKAPHAAHCREIEVEIHVPARAMKTG